MSERPSPADSAYRVLARELRQALLQHRFGEGERLPTEAELARTHGVSRQTVRRAMQDLVTEGMIHRVPGRGTFPAPREDRYLRQFGSIEDLMGLSLDTRLELVLPLQRRVDIAAAGRLHLASDAVMTVGFRRLHDGVPLCFTTVFLPLPVGRLLADVPELREVGATSAITVLGLLDERLGGRVVEAEQSITVAAAPPPVAGCLGCRDGQPLLQIDRVYLDERVEPIELAISWFDPEHYSYRVRLRRSHR